MLLSRRQIEVSPWVSLVEMTVRDQDGPGSQTYHCLAQADYVNVLALTEDYNVVFVRQYRPTLDASPLELPGGLREAGEAPAACALRELTEETGFAATSPLVPLGNFAPDAGRLQNRFHGFFAPAIQRVPDWRPEAGVEPVLIPLSDIAPRLADGSIDQALSLTLIGVALVKGLIDIST